MAEPTDAKLNLDRKRLDAQVVAVLAAAARLRRAQERLRALAARARQIPSKIGAAFRG